MPISVHYLNPDEIGLLSSLPPLCVVGYGVDRPGMLAAACPFVRLQIPALGEACYEAWTVSGAVKYETAGEFVVARTPDVLLAMAIADEGAHWPLEELAEHVYTGLLDLVEESGLHLLRIWNYLPDITGPDKSGKPTRPAMERYRRFNVGRHDAFLQRGQIRTPPAASALGSSGRPTAILALAGARGGKAVENPRQVSAYHYPSQYGPRSPTFSRGTLAEREDGTLLFISGTSSIVGHASVHPGDVAAQTRETFANLRNVLAEAAKQRFAADLSRLKLKVYLRRPEDMAEVQALIEAEFAGTSGTMYLKADICRPELLVEIEAMCPAADAR